MKDCSGIREMLPALFEGDLSGDEIAAVQKHLETCKPCGSALHDLKKSVHLVQHLEEVDPPPWFAQRVMGKIREEAAKKRSGLLRTIFYPLRAKIPLQALASVLILILGLYIYRAVDTGMKHDLLQNRDQNPGQSATISPAPPDIARGKQPFSEDQPGQKPDTAATGNSQGSGKEEASPTASPFDRPARPMIPPPEVKEPARMQNSPLAMSGGREAASELPAPAETEAKMKDAKDSSHPRAELRGGQLMAKKADNYTLTLRVDDVASCVAEVRKRFGELGARDITEQSRNDSATVSAELAGQKVEELRKKLSALGELEASSPSFPAEVGILINIEISRKP